MYSPVDQREGEKAIELCSLGDANGKEEEEEGCFEDEPLPVATGELELHRLSNVAIPLNYFLVGIVQGLAYPLLNVYSLDLGATEAQQLTLLTLKELPSCFKILFGFWSDNFPIAGYRRKPYLYIGWAFSTVSLLPLILITDLSILRQDDSVAVPSTAPTMPQLSSCFGASSLGVSALGASLASFLGVSFLAFSFLGAGVPFS